jgi:hypothetical protein
MFASSILLYLLSSLKASSRRIARSAILLYLYVVTADGGFWIRSLL